MTKFLLFTKKLVYRINLSFSQQLRGLIKKKKKKILPLIGGGIVVAFLARDFWDENSWVDMNARMIFASQC